jgi:hypothetical protein
MTMLAWWDPKGRTLILNPQSVRPGVLSVDEETIAFVTPEGELFNSLIKDADLVMQGILGAWTCAFKIQHGARLYLYPPQGAPRLSKDHLDGIGMTLHAAAYSGMLIGGSLAGLAGVLDPIGDVIDAYSSTKSLLEARKNYKLLQQRIADKRETSATQRSGLADRRVLPKMPPV